MKRAGCILVGLLITATSLSAFGQSAPDGFRDLKWGATQADVQREFPAAMCKTESTPFADWTCYLRGERVNNVPVNVLLRGYSTGHATGFVSFALFFQSNEVRQIVEAFEAKYGRWTKVEEEEFITKGGGKYPNARWIWDFPNASARISQHSGKLGDAQASATLETATKESMERRAAQKGQAGKGL